MNPAQLNGIPVVLIEWWTETVPDLSRPKRRHRKRLIAKRWAKRFGYHTKVVDKMPFYCNGVLHVGPQTLEDLKRFRALAAEAEPLPRTTSLPRTYTVVGHKGDGIPGPCTVGDVAVPHEE